MTIKNKATPLKTETKYFEPHFNLAFAVECGVELRSSATYGAGPSDALILQHFTRSKFDVCQKISHGQNTLLFTQEDFDQTSTDDHIVLYVPNGMKVKAFLSGKRAYLTANCDAALDVTLTNTSLVSKIYAHQPLTLHMDKAKADLDVWNHVNLHLGRGKNSADIHFFGVFGSKEPRRNLRISPYVYETRFGTPQKSFQLEGSSAFGQDFAKTFENERTFHFNWGTPHLKVTSPAPKG